MQLFSTIHILCRRRRAKSFYRRRHQSFCCHLCSKPYVIATLPNQNPNPFNWESQTASIFLGNCCWAKAVVEKSKSVLQAEIKTFLLGLSKSEINPLTVSEYQSSSFFSIGIRIVSFSSLFLLCLQILCSVCSVLLTHATGG